MFAIMKPILYCESCGNIIGVKIRKVERMRRECCNPNPEYLITTIKHTHDAIHYGNDSSIFTPIIERSKNDTCPWK